MAKKSASKKASAASKKATPKKAAKKAAKKAVAKPAAKAADKKAEKKIVAKAAVARGEHSPFRSRGSNPRSNAGAGARNALSAWCLATLRHESFARRSP